MKLNKGKEKSDEKDGLEVIEEVVEEATAKGKVAEVPKAEIPTASLSKETEDTVYFIPTRLIEPAPKIGPWVGRDALGVKRLEIGHKYAMPRHVAQHLQDAKAGNLI